MSREELRTLVGQYVRFKEEETDDPLSLEGYTRVYRVVAENPWGLFVRGDEGRLFIPWPVAGWIRIEEPVPAILQPYGRQEE